MIFNATRASSTVPFRTRVCLVNFSNIEVSCEEVEIPTNKRSENVRLFAPPGMNIWKVRWYTCLGAGTVNIASNDCVFGCCTDPRYSSQCQSAMGQLCPSQPCQERIRPTIYFDKPCALSGPDCDTYLGTHNVKIRLTNNAPVCRRIQYWWEYVTGCEFTTSSVGGISIQANSTIYLCYSISLMSQFDEIQAFKWTDLSSYGQFVDPNNGWEWQVVGDQCCPDGQSCVGTMSSNVCFSPLGLPSCPQ